jgi:hypothetical protein
MSKPTEPPKHDFIRVDQEGKVEVILENCHPDLLDSLLPHIVKHEHILWVNPYSGQYKTGDTFNAESFFGFE